MNKTELHIPCPGYAIAADWYDSGSDKTLLILPGFQSKKERQGDLVAEVALQHGYNALVVDYSGHGDSPFALSETRPAQHLMEVICVFDWLRQQKPEQQISVLGTSYGGFFAAYLTRLRDFSKLILRTPAIYPSEYMYTLSGDIPRGDEAQIYRADAKAVERHPLFVQQKVFTGSTLVVVHEHDEDVPRATSDAYVKAFQAETYLGQGMRHWSRHPENPAGASAASYTAMGEWLAK